MALDWMLGRLRDSGNRSWLMRALLDASCACVSRKKKLDFRGCCFPLRLAQHPKHERTTHASWMAIAEQKCFGPLRYRPPGAAYFLAAFVVVATATIRTWRPHIWLRMATSLTQDYDHLMIGKASISQLLKGLESGRVTSKQLVEVGAKASSTRSNFLTADTHRTQTYLARIEEVNSKVHAVSEVNPRAIDIAIERDRERESGQVRGILHGIPILVKDVFCTADGMNTTGDNLLSRVVKNWY